MMFHVNMLQRNITFGFWIINFLICLHSLPSTVYHKDSIVGWAVGPFFCTAATKALAIAGHGNSY